MSNEPVPNGTTPAGGFLRRMLDPRATYNETEAKASRGWWALFIVGFLVFGILILIAIIIVWRDKKFLKQMGLAIFYVNAPFVVGILVLGVGSIGNIPDMDSLVVFGILAAIAGGVAVPFGLGIAAYAQHKIDRQRMLDGEE